MLTRLRDLTLTEQSASGHDHLSAASGIVVLGTRFYIVGDDECSLAVFSSENDAPGRLVRLLPEVMPADAAMRKAAKPDFEVLLLLPAAQAPSTLLALGSGSTANRRRGALVGLTDGGEVRSVDVLDLSRLYTAIAAVVEEVNVEGAIARDDRLLVFNRGNAAHPDNAILAVDLARVLAGKPVEILAASTLRLPHVNGVPLCVTDACSLDDDTIVVAAVAERHLRLVSRRRPRRGRARHPQRRPRLRERTNSSP
ncbi:hypothetical protein GOARA_027_00020 [Gordonia araii NBRC 100433]|uniref:Uncharacterized protein n=1 Tax=Gordonia araii NBRC 100433 TaxID=1073574 RepID=G7GZL4_9ACTN|nr:hypothetical protein [Gordonia araii]NNG98897.1 hypothetical protein [Gordonia araii NBRC 100433]GAB09039.1 hypothetical protein GOARA_027_00020 [Gordonia araii NBRC 100433]